MMAFFNTLKAGGFFIFAAAFMISGVAHAMPPVDSTFDGLGVDLRSGAYRLDKPVMSIGPADTPDLMALAVSYNSSETRAGAFGKGWSHSYDVHAMRQVEGGSTVVSIVSGMKVEKFTKSGSTYIPDRKNGSMLSGSMSGTLEYLTYRTRNGDILNFSPANNLDCNYPAIPCAYVVETVTKANGEKLTYTYVGSSNKTGTWTLGNLVSVNSSLGWNLSLKYNASNRVISAQMVNLAQEYCGPAHGQPWCDRTDWPKVTFVYSTGNQLASVTDTKGGVWRYGYDTAGRMIWTRRPTDTSNHASITYNTSGVVTKKTLAGVGSWTYSITGSQTIITNPLGQKQTVYFGSASQPQWIKDGLNRQTSFTYDSSGRLTRQTNPAGDYVQFTYDARGNVTETRRVAKPGSSLANIVATAGYPASCSTSEAVRCNKPLWVRDAKGAQTDFTYHATTGAPLTITMPADASGIRARRRFSYQTFYAFTKNSSGSYVQASTPVWRLTETAMCLTGTTCSASADVKTTFSYGSSGVANNRALLTTTQDPGGLNITTSLAYDRWGNLLTVNGPLSGSADLTRLRYDTERRVIGSIQPAPDGAGPLRHPATRITYDINGLAIATESGTVTSQSDAAWTAFAVQERLETTYDTAGRQIEARLKVGSTTEAVRQFSYDSVGRLQCVAERLNPAKFSALPASVCTLGTAGVYGPDRITKNVYDAAGQLTRTISGLGTALEQDSATYSYTLNGMSATFKDAKGNLTSFEYDGYDRLVERRYPDASNGAFSSLSDYESFTYDANGRVIEQFTRDGRLIGIGYDALGRVISKNLPGSAEDVTYSYDLLGRMLEARFTASGKKVTTVYDKASRVLSVTSAGRTLSYQYDAAGRRTRMTWPDGFYVTYSHDMLGRMTAIRENGASSGLGVLASWRYDERGRRAELVRGNGTVTTYAYDALSRLTSLTQDLVGSGQDYDAGFEYSPASQIISRTQTNGSYGWTAPAPGTKTASHNDLNQTTTDAGTGLTYDDNGNLASQGSVTYSYDTENRLTQVSGAMSLSLTYDPLGRLAQTSAGASVTGFLYDGFDMVAEYNATGTLVRRYVHGPATDEPLVWYEGSGTGNPRWLHADERGSIVAVSTANGSSIATYNYGPYGETAPWSGSRFRYTGQMTLPEVGLYHYKARAYSAALGRFLQPDPIGLSGGLNLYAYANGDPINLTDPTGLAPDFEIVVIGQRPKDQRQIRTDTGGFIRGHHGGSHNVLAPRIGGSGGANVRPIPKDQSKDWKEKAKEHLKEIICSLPTFGIGAGMDLYAGLGGSVSANFNFDIPNGRFGLSLTLGVGVGAGAGAGIDLSGLKGAIGPNGSDPLSLNLGVSGGFAAPLAPGFNSGVTGSYNLIGTDTGFSSSELIWRAGTPMVYSNIQASGGLMTSSLYGLGC